MSHWNDPEDRPEDSYDEELESLLDRVEAKAGARPDVVAQLRGLVRDGGDDEGW